MTENEKLIHESLRFFVWAAGQGLCPAEGEPAEGPEEVLFDYATATGFEDYDAFPDAISAEITRLRAQVEELEAENAELREQDDPAFTHAFKLRAEAAESALARSAGVVVKALAWVKPPLSETLSKAETILGDYKVWTHHEADGKWFWSDGNFGGEASSEDMAKAAAWEDYEPKITSALAPIAPERAGSVVELRILFADEGGPANLRFVEVETIDGKSVRAGTWMKKDGYDVLALSVHKSDIAAPQETSHDRTAAQRPRRASNG